MLPKLPLDDRTYEQIVQEARRTIPQRMPEWTDENAHDPGMTMLELFAWLSELQQFYASRIPDRNRRKFLDLLGLAQREAACASVEASFGEVRQTVALPRGTKLMAEDQPFELARETTLLPLAIERVVVRTEREASDMTASNAQGDVAFFAFGRDAQVGSRLYIAFDREPPVGVPVTLSIRLADDDGGSGIGGAVAEAVTPSARVSWKGHAWDEESGEAVWEPLDIAADETLHLSYSGRLTFTLRSPLRPVLVHPAGDRPRHWICCTVEEAGYELPPRIDRIVLNTALAVQRDTKCESAVFDSPGEPGFELVVDGYLARFGECRVQVREPDGRWREWRRTDDLSAEGPEARAFAAIRDDQTPGGGPLRIRFGDGTHGAYPPEGRQSVRVVTIESAFVPSCLLGRSNGLPRQRFPIYDLPCKQRDAFRLQIGQRCPRTGDWLWEDWEPVGHFDRSGPLDRHYVYDPDTGELRFGDDERGAIPPACDEPNIALIGCVFGGGERGNIQPHLLSRWMADEQRQLGLTVTNIGYGRGGADAESLDEAMARAQREWQQPFRAVTDADYERLACSVPGLKVARAHAIPRYAPGRSEPAPGAVTVVVVPLSREKMPLPSPGFLQTVARHLDARRLVTTEVHVVAPAYVKVTVHATVVVEPGFVEEHRRIAAALRELLSPFAGEDGSGGWPFGRTVYKGDIYGVVTRIRGVAYIQELWLDAEGQDVRKSPGGDVLLPPNGLVYSGEHHIELISRTDAEA